MSESTTTQQSDTEHLPQLELVAELFHEDFSLELESMGPDRDMYVFTDEPQETLSDSTLIHGSGVTEALLNARKRNRFIFEQVDKLGISQFVEAVGFTLTRHDDEDAVTTPRAGAIDRFQQQHPGLITLGWHEQPLDGRFSKEEVHVRLSNGQALLNDGRDGPLGLIYGHHDHVEHGIGYVLTSPLVGELIKERAQDLFMQYYFEAENGDEIDELQGQIAGLVEAFDHYTVDVVLAMAAAERGEEDIIELDDAEYGLLTHVQSAMRAKGVTRDDVVADIVEHTQRLRDFEPDLGLVA